MPRSNIWIHVFVGIIILLVTSINAQYGDQFPYDVPVPPDPMNIPDARQKPVTETVKEPETTNPDSVKETPPAPKESARSPTPEGLASLIFIAAIVSLSVVGCVAFVGGMYCWYKHTAMTSTARRVLYRSSDSRVLIHNDYQPMGDGNEAVSNGHTHHNLSKLAEKTDYPAYGVTGPNPLHCQSRGQSMDLNLNHSAEVFHYQQQKQRLKKMNSLSSNGSSHSKHSTPDQPNDPASTVNPDDEENSDGEYTVYECPGLAATSDGPLEIHNPMFADSESSFSSYTTQTRGLPAYDYATALTGQ